VKTVIVTRRYPPQRCGVGDFVYKLAAERTRRGEEVVVVTAECAEPRPAGARVTEVQLEGPRAMEALAAAIEREGADEVQLEYSPYGWSRWGGSFGVNRLLRRLRRRGLRVRVALHEMFIEWSAHPARLALALLQRAHIALLALEADEIIVNTRQRQRRLERWLRWKGTPVRYRPNASNVALTPLSESERRRLRAEHGAGRETIVVATFGSFGAGKQYETAIDAVAALAPQRDLRLWLLGDWTAADPRIVHRLRESARAAGIEEKTFWSGPQPEERISALLQAADIFLLTQGDGDVTRSGAFMAAAAHGLAAVVVRNAENQQELRPGEDVLCAAESSGAEFARAIERLAGDGELRRRLGANLRAVYEREFDWKAMLGERGGEGTGKEERLELAGEEPGLAGRAAKAG
jgi:glycosyltransferase involved in cell wall biosynthesis